MANEKTEIMLDSIGMVYKDQGGNDVTALTNVTLDIKMASSSRCSVPRAAARRRSSE